MAMDQPVNSRKSSRFGAVMNSSISKSATSALNSFIARMVIPLKVVAESVTGLQYVAIASSPGNHQ